MLKKVILAAALALASFVSFDVGAKSFASPASTSGSLSFYDPQPCYADPTSCSLGS